jgi:tRNA threonylcarbamoyladenosine biosynthesis protein TsaB
VITLALDAAVYVGSVAVLDGDRVLAEGTAPMRGREAERLMPEVVRTLKEAGSDVAGVDRVVCGAGPGSFTSLRIAASLAKGIAAGRSIPLYGVSSLALVVAGNQFRGGDRYLAALDAMRGETYVCLVEIEADAVRSVGDVRLVASRDVVAAARDLGARAVGPDQPGGWLPHARGVAALMGSLAASGAVDMPSWEPSYGRLAEAQVKWEAAHGRALPR